MNVEDLLGARRDWSLPGAASSPKAASEAVVWSIWWFIALEVVGSRRWLILIQHFSSGISSVSDTSGIGGWRKSGHDELGPGCWTREEIGYWIGWGDWWRLVEMWMGELLIFVLLLTCSVPWKIKETYGTLFRVVSICGEVMLCGLKTNQAAKKESAPSWPPGFLGYPNFTSWCWMNCGFVSVYC